MRYSTVEAAKAFPKKYILLINIKEDADGMLRGDLAGTYSSAEERSDAYEKLSEERKIYVALAEGEDVFGEERLGGIYL